MSSSSAAETAAWAASRAEAVAVAAAGRAEAYSAAAAAMAVAVAANVAAAEAADDDADGRTWVDDLVDESTQLWIDDPESAVAAAVESSRLAAAANARQQLRRLRNRLAPY